MDLKKLDCVSGSNEGFEVTLFNPKTMADLDITVTVLGRDSARYRMVSNEQQRRRVAKMSKGGVFRPGTINPDEIERDVTELLAACTLGWKNLTEGETEVPFTRENAVRIYSEYPWIREQVDAAVADRANFMKSA